MIDDRPKLLEYKPEKRKLKVYINNKVKTSIVLFFFILANFIAKFLSLGEAFVNLLFLALIFWISVMMEGYYEHRK